MLSLLATTELPTSRMMSPGPRGRDLGSSVVVSAADITGTTPGRPVAPPSPLTPDASAGRRQLLESPSAPPCRRLPSCHWCRVSSAVARTWMATMRLRQATGLPWSALPVVTGSADSPESSAAAAVLATSKGWPSTAGGYDDPEGAQENRPPRRGRAWTGSLGRRSRNLGIDLTPPPSADDAIRNR
jgi:hypothetical protein